MREQSFKRRCSMGLQHTSLSRHTGGFASSSVDERSTLHSVFNTKNLINEWMRQHSRTALPCTKVPPKSAHELLLLVISRQRQNYGAFPSFLHRPAGIGSAIWNPGYSLTSRTSSVQTPVHTSKQAATLTLPSATHFSQPITTILNVTFFHEAFSNSSNC